MNENSLVSIIIAAYNSASTIRAAIASIICQVDVNYEIVICDDASNDATIDIVREFNAEKITLIINKENEGPGPARDKAILAARGKWITFLDADDIFLPERLRKLLNIAEKYPHDIICDAIVDCHDTKNGLVPWRVAWNHLLPPEDGDCLCIDFSEFMHMKRSIIQPLINRSLILTSGAAHGRSRNGEDLYFLMPIFQTGAVIRYTGAPTYLYRMTSGSLSTSNPERHKLYKKVLQDCRAFFPEDEIALSALDYKIKEVSKLELYRCFYTALTALKLLNAYGFLVKEPWLLKEFTLRVFDRLPFHLHRIAHGGLFRRVS